MANDAAPFGAGPQARMTALSLADAAMVLSRSGQRPVTEAMIQEDLAAGAPRNFDGTINLIHYAAWILKEIAHGS
mgnify:FL=1